MGTYINIGNTGFQRARNCEYVDKSGLIAVVNKTLFTERCFSCVTRSRRFGKSMAAKMLCAYYDQSCDSRSLFADLKIAQDASFEKHLNKYPVIFLDLSNCYRLRLTATMMPWPVAWMPPTTRIQASSPITTRTHWLACSPLPITTPRTTM